MRRGRPHPSSMTLMLFIANSDCYSSHLWNDNAWAPQMWFQRCSKNTGRCIENSTSPWKGRAVIWRIITWKPGHLSIWSSFFLGWFLGCDNACLGSVILLKMWFWRLCWGWLSWVPCTCHSTMMLVYWVLAGVILTCFCNDDSMPMYGWLAHNIYQSSFALVSWVSIII